MEKGTKEDIDSEQSILLLQGSLVRFGSLEMERVHQGVLEPAQDRFRPAGDPEKKVRRFPLELGCTGEKNR